MGGSKGGKIVDFPIMQHVKGNYSLLPVIFVCGFGVALSSWQILRTLTKSPDIHLNKTKNPRPYEKLETPDGKAIQFKYYSNRDYSQFNSERPRLD